MRGSLLGSTLVHLAVLVALFVVRPPTPMVIAGPESVEVALVDPSSLPRARTSPPPQRVEPREPDPSPPAEEDEGVRLESKPRPKPKPPEPAREREPEARPAQAPSAAVALPTARFGNTGLSGQVGVDASDFAFTWYLVQVRDRIWRNWSPPVGLQSGGAPVRAVVYFRITREGRLRDVRLETPSGTDYFDRAAQRAVQISEPLPPLPAAYTQGWLGVHFGFEYQQP